MAAQSFSCKACGGMGRVVGLAPALAAPDTTPQGSGCPGSTLLPPVPSHLWFRMRWIIIHSGLMP